MQKQNLTFPLDRMCEHIICDAQDVFAVVLDDAVYHAEFADLAWNPVGKGLPSPTCAAIMYPKISPVASAATERVRSGSMLSD